MESELLIPSNGDASSSVLEMGASASALEQLPHEILPLIARHLTARDVCSLERCSRRLQKAMQSDSVWAAVIESQKAWWPQVGYARARGDSSMREAFRRLDEYARRDAEDDLGADGGGAVNRALARCCLSPLHQSLSFSSRSRASSSVVMLGREASGKQKVLKRLLIDPSSPLQRVEGHELSRTESGVALRIVDSDVVLRLSVVQGLLWESLFRSCHGVIYTVPSACTKDKLEVTRAELHRLLNLHDYECTPETSPVLIMITQGSTSSVLDAASPRSGFGDAGAGEPLVLSPYEFAEQMGLFHLAARPWRVQRLDFSRSFEGLREGVLWLARQLQQHPPVASAALA